MQLDKHAKKIPNIVTKQKTYFTYIHDNNIDL